MTLRSRLALLFGLVALLVGAVVGFSAFQATRGELADTTDRFLEQRAADLVVGTRVQQSQRRGDRDDDGTELRLAFDADSIVQTVGVDGTVEASSGGELPITDDAAALVDAKPGAGRIRDSFEDIVIDGERFRLYNRALADGGVIQVARSIDENVNILSQLTGRFALIALLASLGASIAGWLIAQRTTRPLRGLATVAANVAETHDFSVEVPVDRTDEIGKLARSFREMLDALETSREQQHRLVHDAGHELRTPLTSLRANVDLLERAARAPDGPLTADDRVEVLDAVRSELGELGNLFDELMELATDTRDRDVPMERCDLDDVVRRTVERWERRTGRSISIQSESAMVIGNAPRLERAVANLIGNAHKFSPPDAAIHVVASGGSIVVRDDGPGIAEADRRRVFDRFYRADETRAMPGSGLGLAIVAQIVRQHGGTVSAGQAPSGGAEVGFQLPLA